MFHRPVEEVWQDLHTQINLLGAAPVHRREKVMTFVVFSKESRLQVMCSGDCASCLQALQWHFSM